MEAGVRPSNSHAEDSTYRVTAESPFVLPGSVGGPTSEVNAGPATRSEQAEPSSTTTLPRLASIRGSTNGLQDESERWGANRQTDRPSDGEETAATRQGNESFSGNVLRPENISGQEVVVLTPSRLRLDSRVVLAHATIQWLTNAVWAVLIWKKLDGSLNWSWWAIFSPTIANHALHIPMQILVLLLADYMVYKQIGPPPPLHASPGLVLQYAIIRHVRVRSHRVDWANNALESVAVFIVKCLFCDALQRNALETTSLRLIFIPIWACWVLTVALTCFKDRTERMFGSSRDLFFIFLLFVAFKVDNYSSYSWRVVFLVPWMWFSGLLLVAALVLLLLLFAKVWARTRELLLPIGFMLLLLSTLPQFLSYIALVRRLDGDTGTSIASIMWPNALSWLLMWLSGLLIAYALRQKEVVRDALLERGAVWTRHEAVARRLHAERDEAQRRVDELSEDEVSRLVESMMAGKTKPGRLKRVGENLYKRIASLEPALAEQAAQEAVAGMQAEGVPRRSVSVSGPDMAGGAASAPAADLRTASTAGDAASSRPPTASSGGVAGLVGFRHNRVVPTNTNAGSPNTSSAANVALAGGAGPAAGGAAAAPLGGRSGRWVAGGAAAGPAPADSSPSPSPLLELQPLDGGRGSVEADRPAASTNGVPAPASTASRRTRMGTAAGDTTPGRITPTPNPAAASTPTLIPPSTNTPGQARERMPAPDCERASPSSRSSLAPSPAQDDGTAAAPAPATTSAAGLPGRTSSRPRGAAVLSDAASGSADAPSRVPSGAGTVEGGGPGSGVVADGSSASSSAAGGTPGKDQNVRQEQEAAAAAGTGAGLVAGAAPAAVAAASNHQRRSPAVLVSESEGGDAVSTAAGGPALGSSPRGSGTGTTLGPEAVGREPSADGEEEGGGRTDPGGASPVQPTLGSNAPQHGVQGSGGAVGMAAAGDDDELDNACLICYDHEASCVFLECGHGGFCRRCAYLLFVRPPNECPTCRAVIDQVVEIEAAAAVGEVARVK